MTRCCNNFLRFLLRVIIKGAGYLHSKNVKKRNFHVKTANAGYFQGRVILQNLRYTILFANANQV